MCYWTDFDEFVFFCMKIDSESGLRQNKACKQDHSPGNRLIGILFSIIVDKK